LILNKNIFHRNLTYQHIINIGLTLESVTISIGKYRPPSVFLYLRKL